MSNKINTAMIFGAGLGTRMRPLTNITPKPLVPVNGKPIIEYTLDKLQAHGVENIVVNAYHLAEKLEEYLFTQTSLNITVITEKERLETGGGLVNALPYLGEDKPFFVINGDIIWTDIAGDSGNNALAQLEKSYNPDTMDALLLLIKREDANGYAGNGDFELDGSRLVRSEEQIHPYVFAGVQVFHPRLLQGYNAEPFSLGKIYRDDHTAKLHGLVHNGSWFHISTPEDVERFPTILAEK